MRGAGIDSEKQEKEKSRKRQDLKKYIWHVLGKNTATRVRNDRMKAEYRKCLKSF